MLLAANVGIQLLQGLIKNKHPPKRNENPHRTDRVLDYHFCIISLFELVSLYIQQPSPTVRKQREPLAKINLSTSEP